MKKELIVFKDPKSPISEIFRTLRTNIQFMSTNRSSKTILITSTFASEGKSWVSSNLAVAFAQTGKKVLLIDADMRKGRQYNIWGIAPKPGLSNYLSGVNISENSDSVSANITDYIQKTPVENLYVIAAGNIPPNPSELLISPQMVNLLEQVKEMCDIVIIDGTPSLLVTDSLILTRMVDSTLVVTACEETKREELNRVITNIQNVGGKISGIVLNKVPVVAKKYEERYYYSSNAKEKVNNNSKKASTININDLKEKTSKVLNKNINITTSGNRKTEDRNSGNIVNTSNNGNPRNLENMNGNISIDKTNDILRQINEYLDKEKNSKLK